jgi:hypothetical protein
MVSASLTGIPNEKLKPSTNARVPPTRGIRLLCAVYATDQAMKTGSQAGQREWQNFFRSASLNDIAADAHPGMETVPRITSFCPVHRLKATKIHPSTREESGRWIFSRIVSFPRRTGTPARDMNLMRLGLDGQECPSYDKECYYHGFGSWQL